MWHGSRPKLCLCKDLNRWCGPKSGRLGYFPTPPLYGGPWGTGRFVTHKCKQMTCKYVLWLLLYYIPARENITIGTRDSCKTKHLFSNTFKYWVYFHVLTSIEGIAPCGSSYWVHLHVHPKIESIAMCKQALLVLLCPSKHQLYCHILQSLKCIVTC